MLGFEGASISIASPSDEASSLSTVPSYGASAIAAATGSGSSGAPGSASGFAADCLASFKAAAALSC